MWYLKNVGENQQPQVYLRNLLPLTNQIKAEQKHVT